MTRTAAPYYIILKYHFRQTASYFHDHHAFSVHGQFVLSIGCQGADDFLTYGIVHLNFFACRCNEMDVGVVGVDGGESWVVGTCTDARYN